MNGKQIYDPAQPVILETQMVKVAPAIWVAWYDAHLRGFHKVPDAGRGKDLFYNDAGTLAVLVMGSKGNADTRSVSYYRFEPGTSAKAIVSMMQGKIVCQ